MKGIGGGKSSPLYENKNNKTLNKAPQVNNNNKTLPLGCPPTPCTLLSISVLKEAGNKQL